MTPKASAREFHQKHFVVLRKALLGDRLIPPGLESLSGGPAPTASGANSVASALGSLPRRDPGEAVRAYHEGLEDTLKLGTFYLAVNRNFLLGSNTD